MLIDFPEPLIEAVVVDRPNRFIMDIELDGEVQRYHSPTTGKIGNLHLPGTPCLVLPSSDANRRTRGTVQALRVGEEWLGINQAAANRFVEAALMERLLSGMVDPDLFWTEVTLGNSRIDFRCDENVLMEVKSPLTILQVGGEVLAPAGPSLAAGSLSRLIRHFRVLEEWARVPGNRSLVLMAFQHGNPGFQARSGRESEVGQQVSRSLDAGVEIWQANFLIEPEGVDLIGYWNITDTFRA